jgi:hypothetical protein
MRSNYLKTLKTAVLLAGVLLLGAGLAGAQQQINLTAAPTTVTLPDGSVVPMWGYFCGAPVTTNTTPAATCAALNPASAGTGGAASTWSPVVITVPTGQALQINLTNNLAIATGTTGFNLIPTSLTIVGQLGGGLGIVGQRTTTASPTHENMGTTWPIANTGPVWNPPPQGPRVQSFSMEVQATPSTTAQTPTSLTWTAPRPGTYLLESGTHPSIQGPMGLYGIVVVTAAPAATGAGCAYPGAAAGTCAVPYNSEIPLLFSEIDPVQNNKVNTATSTAGFSESATLGPYGIEPLASVNIINGGSGYTSAPGVSFSGSGQITAATAHAVIDTDPTSSTYQQVIQVVIDTGGSYTSAPNISFSGGGGTGAAANTALQLATSTTCVSGSLAGNVSALACYPPAVNYTPLYYLINGLAFDKTQNTPTSLTKPSLFAASAVTGVTTGPGSVLVRWVNAGLHMHVPSIVGSLTTPAIVATGAPPATPTAGFSLVAEDGNPLPGVSRVQSEVFMAAGKTYDVMIDVPAAGGTALPVFDRELSLSGNAIARDAGMLGYISVNGAGMPAAPGLAAAVARADTYSSVVPCAAAPCKGVTVSDPGLGVIANDTNVYGVQLLTAPTGGTVTLNANGTFTYVQNAGTTTDSFSYCANGSVTAGVCSSSISTTVTLGAATVEAAGGITCGPSTYSSNVATALGIKPPGILSACTDGAGYPLTVASSTGNAPVPSAGLTLSVDPNGGFNASVAAAGTYTFTFKAQNSQGTVAAATATVTLTFPAANGPVVTVVDGQDKTTRITDYRWIIEEDRTFYINPACTTNPPPSGCPTSTSGIVPTFGTNFHTSYMPVIAAGCTGPLSCESGQTLLGVAAVCDVGNGVCRTTGSQQTTLDPTQVHLDPTKRYYISVLPGDAGNPFANGYGGPPACTSSGGVSTPNPNCGHGMGGSPIACIPTSPAVTCTATGTFAAVTILSQPAPYPTAKLSVFVFEDDFPLNGEQDGGGGVNVLAPNEPGLGGFNLKLFDDAGGTGDATGQMTYDMFNMPLSNSLAGTIDPATGLDACPLSGQVTDNVLHGDGTQKGITGEIVTCPTYESDNQTLSPIAGQAVIANLMPGRYGVVATPAADRIARGEEWLQTNTLDGQKAHDSFLRIGEPSFFQEYGPAGYHVSIGFANPQIINDRKLFVCNGSDPNISGSNCTNSVAGVVTTERMSRTPDQRLYSSGDNTSFGFTQCYVSFGDPDGEDFAFTKCAGNGSFTLSGLPDGVWRITVFDQWNDMLVDGLSTPVQLSGGATLNLGELAMNQWQANIYTTSFFDMNGNGIQDANETGLTLVSTNNRFRDGSYSNFNNTDLAGNAGFNEIFPLFSWYVIESDSTRYKTTGIHVVYDAGGPADGSSSCGANTAPCGSSSIGSMLANTVEQVPLPTNLRVPGALYCDVADCTGTNSHTLANPSTGRIDPPFWFGTEGWQGFSGQNQFVQFGKKPYAVGETGGIHGEVIYASTRPFDDPTLLIHTSWTPDVPGVVVNLYKEGTAPDGSQSLTLIDTTKTSSWDDWAQGFRSDGVPNMNCPGQLPAPAGTTPGDLFFFSLYNQPMWLDQYNNGGTAANTIPLNSQFKCYDGMHNWNQVQPAPYDGMYSFPSVTNINPANGKPNGTNCTACIPNPDSTDAYRAGTPMLPAGKYVVEILVPPGYELVKEEDKNILIGDNYIAPVAQQFAGLGNIFIVPDQAEVDSFFNSNNAQNPTQTLGRFTYPNAEGDTGSVEVFWPCVGAMRTVPDYISLFPQSGEVSPFAGATRPLCDRKEVTLTDQTSALAKFWIFSSTHVAAHYTGVITDDFTSEFDPFSPTFGEKFSPPDLPISIKDWSGTEISRTYADHWGAYTGLTYSTWEVNPPNPTGYAPTMMVTCMNDPGPMVDRRATIIDPTTGSAVANPTYNQMISDPLFNPEYSQFCYEIPFMPGQTQYMDTPVVPTSAFAGAGYNNPDCAYPNAMPAIKEVDGDGVGPWLNASGALSLTITALGDQLEPNNAYTGPSANTAPYNAKTVVRHYGFGPTTGLPGGCTNGNANAACPNVTVGGVPLHGVSWSDTTITGTVQATAVPACNIQQQGIYGGSAAKCGELVITAANGLQSIDTVTVTIGGKAPTHVAASASVQAAIDAADPGDLLLIDPTCTTTTGGVTTQAACTPITATSTQNHSQGAHNEILIMWKPVRLQGVGAASSIINANTHPAGKLDDWRARIVCLFGLGLNGSPSTWNSSCGTSLFGSNVVGFHPSSFNPQVDRLPLEATVGWDASLNGNLGELLQEPTLMGALEGAGITVLSKGVYFPSDPFAAIAGEPGGFPDGTILFSASNTATYCPTSATTGNYTSNFWCNPASIDGLTITDSSQGGGGIFVHGWGHNIEIANNRVQNNAGTLGGGINIGQGEFPGAYLLGSATNSAPGSCTPTSSFGTNLPNSQQPYCHDLNVNVHNNAVSLNSSNGDELFSATPAGAGGVNFTAGSDYYKFKYNWVCGNLSTGDGGGLGHIGFSYFGDIEHNTFLFNQSTNPTISSNGGAMVVMGAPDVDPTCGTQTDQDCVPFPAGSVGPSDGTGPGLVINANLIMGNQAESGTGGAISLQAVNGADVVSFPDGASVCSNPSLLNADGTSNCNWNSVTLTNNIIVNNVAGWDGAGVSFVDTLAANFINNTVISNDSTASAGVLFDTIGAPRASTAGSNCYQSGPTGANTASCPQVAGLVSIQNSAVLAANLSSLTVTCPTGHGTTGSNGTCKAYSVPLLDNDLFWQNRSFQVGISGAGTGTLNQQNVVSLFNASFSGATGSAAATQASTGACPAGSSYWDIGVRGDTGPANHNGGLLSPSYSFVGSGYPGANNSTGNPTVVRQYCNGSRVPPEAHCISPTGTSIPCGWQVPPGIADATVPNPVFNLTPTATVDEGNNWVNIAWGPLAETGPTTQGSGQAAGTMLGNYGLGTGSTAINYIPSTASGTSGAYTLAPTFDFFGTNRKSNGFVDAGAVEFAGATATATLSVSPTSLVFGSVPTGTTSATQNLTLSNTGTAGATGIGVAVSGPFTRVTTGAFPAGAPSCGTTLSAGANCTIKVASAPTAVGPSSGSVTITANVPVTGSPVSLTGGGTANAIVGFSAPSPLLTTTPATTTTKNGTITVTNSGTGPLTLTAAPTIAKTAGGATTTGSFSITGGTCTSGTVVAAAGGTCTINVQYIPNATGTIGTATGTVTLTDTGAATGTQTTSFSAN